MVRGLKFRIYIVEGLYFPCSENKGADQLCGHRKADLRLCFRIFKKPVFSQRGSYTICLDCHDYVHNTNRPMQYTAIFMAVRFYYFLSRRNKVLI